MKLYVGVFGEGEVTMVFSLDTPYFCRIYVCLETRFCDMAFLYRGEENWGGLCVGDDRWYSMDWVLLVYEFMIQ